MATSRRRNNITGVLFLLPNLVLLMALTLFPVLYAFYLGFFQWDIISEPVFVGLENYLRLARSERFWQVLFNTVYYTVGTVPLQLFVALIIAVLLNQGIRGKTAYRMVFFLPVVTSWVAVALLFRWLYNPDFGLINYVLSFVGIPPLPWLSSPGMAMPAVILTNVWKSMGYFAVIFLAGLQGVPQEMLESASIDGAGPFRRFINITLPMLTPTLFFVIIISIIQSFQVFEQVLVMTEGGPMDATNVLVLHIYDNAFRWFRMGYAVSMAWTLFVVIFVLTLLQMKFQNRWVFYR